jgi:protein TonB
MTQLPSVVITLNRELAVFQYEADKAAEGVVAKLQPFRGTLTADAEHRFNAVYATGRVVEAGCNAHGRRKFRDAEATQPVLAAEGGDPSMAANSQGSSTPTPVIAPVPPSPVVTTTAPTAVAPGPIFDPGAYLEGVTDRVRRHRNYPAIAQEMGLEGTVEVRVVVAPDGTLVAPPTIDESCGHEVLDDEALRIVRRAAPFPPLVGRSQRVTLRVPVHFHLDT